MSRRRLDSCKEEWLASSSAWAMWAGLEAARAEAAHDWRRPDC